MRIIAGEARGRTLYAPKGMETRPTADRVRESLFNILARRVTDARVFDAFAGSGAMSLEALSRGARCVVLSDISREACRCVQRNAEACGFQSRIRLVCGEWKKALAAEKEPFDLVFLDPPYRMLELNEMCAALADSGLLAQDAMMVLEHRTGEFGRPDKRFEEWKERTYADTQIHFYLYAGLTEGE